MAILGATGSGKTSLVNLIPRFYDATVGVVLVDDMDVRNIAGVAAGTHCDCAAGSRTLYRQRA